MDHLQNELKKEFQLERMILFSDAVFAIAITLLVIELKVPGIPKQAVTESRLSESLAELIPKFMGFFLSFFIIGLFWTIHHRMFGYVVNYDRKLLVLNLFFLLSIVLMPFSTSFYSEYVARLLKSPVIVYVTNICFLGIMNIVLWGYISNPRNNLSEGLHPLVARYYMTRSVATPMIFLIMGLVYIFIDPRLVGWILPFISVIISLLTTKYKKRIKKLNIPY